MPLRPADRVLTTIVFTDIVGSTSVAAEMGDERWKELLARHHRLTRDALKRFRGREHDTAGDGFFASFRSPTDAIRAVVAIRRDVGGLGLEIRAGVHFGEAELMNGKPSGMAVVTASRVMSMAGPGEILVTAASRDVMSGLRLVVAEVGTTELRGVPGDWQILRIEGVDGEVLDPILDPSEGKRRRDEIEVPVAERRRVQLVAAAAAIVLLVAGGVLLSVIGPEARAPVAPRASEGGPSIANSLVRIDAATSAFERVSAVSATISPVRIPVSVAVGQGSVWVMDSKLRRFDPVTGEELGSTDWAPGFVNIAVCCRVVWVAHGVHYLQTPRPGLILVNPATGKRFDQVRFTPHGEVVISDVAAEDGNVVAAMADGWLVSVDAGSLDASSTDLGGILTSVAIADEDLWVTDSFSGEVIRLDRSSLEEIDRITVGGDPQVVALGEGSAWVITPASGTLTKIDLASANPVDPFQVGPSPSDVVVGLGAVWVADLEEGTIRKIHPASGAPLGSIDVGAPVGHLAIDEETGTIWATTIAFD